MSDRPAKRPYHFAIVPLDWFERAADLGTVRALRVGVHLWRLALMAKTRRRLHVSLPTIVFEVGGSLSGASRGLQDLAAAGLCEVRSRPRHGFLVTLPDDATLLRWLEEDQTMRAEEGDDEVVWSARPTPTRRPRRAESTAVHP